MNLEKKSLSLLPKLDEIKKHADINLSVKSILDKKIDELIDTLEKRIKEKNYSVKKKFNFLLQREYALSFDLRITDYSDFEYVFKHDDNTKLYYKKNSDKCLLYFLMEIDKRLKKYVEQFKHEHGQYMRFKSNIKGAYTYNDNTILNIIFIYR